MASNLNKMVEDIRRLMDKERESERTKNELITNGSRPAHTVNLDHRISGAVIRPGSPAAGDAEKYIDIAYSKAKRLKSSLRICSALPR